MSNLSFTQEELDAMLKMYLQQHAETLEKLRSLNSIIAKLSGRPSHSESAPTNKVIIEKVASQETADNTANDKVRKGPKKKRGRQPIWADMILKSLKKFERPLTYKDLYREAKIYGGINGDDKDQTIKAAVNQSINRLRNINKKISSTRLEGKTGVYLVLNKWLNEDGKLMDEFARRSL